jgi:hypothetical protein
MKAAGAFTGLPHLAGLLGHSDRIGFELTAHQDEPAKEHGAYDKKVDQNWHSHRCLPTKRDWENLGRICLTIADIM